MIAAQQYYIEFCSELNSERLLTLLPNYIPDYCLTNGDKSIDRWATLTHLAYKKVSTNLISVQCMLTYVEIMRFTALCFSFI